MAIQLITNAVAYVSGRWRDANDPATILTDLTILQGDIIIIPDDDADTATTGAYNTSAATPVKVLNGIDVISIPLTAADLNFIGYATIIVRPAAAIEKQFRVHVVTALIDANVTATKAKTDNLPASPAAVGSEMDLVDAPNAIAVTAIQSGLSTHSAANVRSDIDANSTQLAALVLRLSAARAGYLDNLNIGGLVASAADVSAITQASRVRIVTPPQMIVPDSGSTDYRVWIYSYNEQHQAEDLDAVPAVTAENNAGTDRSSNLGTVTKQGASTGIYYVDYSVAAAHLVEGLVLKITATENAVATEYAASSLVVDTIAVDFTGADRTKLDAVFTDTQTNLPAQVTTAQNDLDILTGADGVVLDSTQGNYAPAIAGDEMDLVASPNAAAIAAIRTAILDRLLSGNHDVAGTPGEYLQLLAGLSVFDGMTSLPKWLTTLLFDGDPNATAKAEINALGSADYDETLHSIQKAALSAAQAVAILQLSSVPVGGTPNFYSGGLVSLVSGDSYGEVTSGFDAVQIVDSADIWYAGVTSDLMYFAVKPSVGNTLETATIHVSAAHVTVDGHKAAKIILPTAVTELISGGYYNYHLYAVDSGAEAKTLAIGKMVLEAKQWDTVVPA